MQHRTQVDSPWWRTAPTTVICYHPWADRYFPCAWVEKCAWCKALRFTPGPYVHGRKLWLPVTTKHAR